MYVLLLYKNEDTNASDVNVTILCSRRKLALDYAEFSSQ